MSLDYFKKYNYKIRELPELKKLLKKKKNKKTVLCHGVFDVVHPGHLRHLAHAKTKGDILVVSLTADRFIKKGTYRPHVPENLRALNLSAFEMVDYVVIDRHEKANYILKYIKPDFYAKGFEYFSKGLPKATKDEIKVVESYGGKMFFSPGDYVYSSSKFLQSSLPELNFEKLFLLLDKNKISFNDLKKTLKSYSKLKVHVIGDTIVDTYTRTSFIGGQTKTPTFSLLKQKEDNFIGGAAIVASHLKKSGADVTFSTVLGNDQLGKFVIRELKKIKVKIKPIIDSFRPTTNKNSFTTGIYKLLKVDTLDNTPINENILNKLCLSIKNTKTDIVILSDFRHGIFNLTSIPKLINSIPKKTFKVADSQVASRWGNILQFKKFDLITPNEREARFALADQDSPIGSLSYLLQKNAKYKNLILTLGDKGIFCSSKSRKNDYFSIDSFAKSIVDAVGSGDALLAYSSIALKLSKSLVQAGIIGSLAAAKACEYDGNQPVSIEEVIEKINDIEKKVNYPNN